VTVDRTDLDRARSLLAWTGPVGILLVLVGWMVLAGFLPPPSPSLSPSDTVAVWADHTNLKRIGMILAVWGGVLYVPFTVAVAEALWRDAGPGSRLLAVAQGAMGTFGTVFFSLNFFILAMAPYRIEQAPDRLPPMYDLGMAMTFAPVAPFTFQYALIAAAILQNRSGRPVIPRWVAYVNLWVAILLIPATLIPFVKSGPLAWNGVLSFWIPVIVFVGWFGVMFWSLRRSPAAATDPDPATEVRTPVG
jgi:hypothetical protein